MKLKKIKIVNFGQFSNVTFDLSSPKLNVFYGTNEAGKSTVVAFIKQIMFGFHLKKQSSAFFEDYTPLARVSPMGGSLFFENDRGDHFELERLYAGGKGLKGGTLTVKLNEQIVPESVFFEEIKNIDGDFYADSFIFNQDMLAKVEKIQQTDLLERIYYLGASNSDQLIDLRDDFAKKASEIFKKMGSNPPLNVLFNKLKDQRIKVDEAENEFNDYRTLSEQEKTQASALEEQERALQKLQSEQEQLRQLQNQVPNYRKLIELEQEVEQVKFDPEKYQAAQRLDLEGKNLQKEQSELEQQLANFSSNDENQNPLKLLVQKKPEILQWRAEDRDCQQDFQQVSQQQEQLLTLNPDLHQITNLTQADIIQLQNDFEKLPAFEDNTSSSENAVGKYAAIGSGLIIVIGIILLVASSPLIGGLVMLIGLVGACWGIGKQKQEKRVLNQQAKQAKLIKEQRITFSHKYGLNPDQLDLHSLVNEWRQYQMLEQKKQNDLQHERELNEQLAKIAMKISATLDRSIEPSFEAVIASLDELENRLANSQHIADQRIDLQKRLAKTQAELHDLNLRLKTAFAQAQVQDMAEYQVLQAKSIRQAELKTKISLLKDNLGENLAEIKQLQESDQLAKKLETVQIKITQKQKVIKELQTEDAEIKVKMTNLANSNAVFAAKQELANTETEFRNLSIEYLANLAASKWISRALDLASNERFPKMLKTAKEYLRLLTNNRYNSLNIDKKLTVTRFDGKKIKVQYLSRGTSEQLYFALKLAFVEQIKDQINLPILIDDSFVNFDDQRVNQIKQLLGQVSENNQVLIFTAQAGLVEKLQLKPLTFTKGTE